MKKIIIISLLVLATASCKKTTSVLPYPSPKQLILGTWVLKSIETKEFKGDTLIKNTVENVTYIDSLTFMNNNSYVRRSGNGSLNGNYDLIGNQVLLMGDNQFHILTLNTNQLSYLSFTRVTGSSTTQHILTYTKN